MVRSKMNMLMQRLPLYALSMINGKLLGDANILIEKTRRPRLRFSHTVHDKEWCLFCYEQLSKYIRFAKLKYRKIVDPRTKSGFTEHYYVQSLTSEIIDLLREIWYPNDKKIIPFSFLSHTLHPVCLAWWYQDDGHLKIEKNQVKKVVLSTDSFSYEENRQLIHLIYEKYKLKFSLDKQNRLILYDQPQIFYFISIIKPHVHPSMSRKISIPNLLETHLVNSRRTTIYLPKHLKVHQPTKDIHQILAKLPLLYKQLCNRETYHMMFCTQFPKLNIEKQKLKPYQICLYKEQLEWLYKCKSITGLSISHLIHLCFLVN
jgi:hypothetical protein